MLGNGLGDAGSAREQRERCGGAEQQLAGAFAGKRLVGSHWSGLLSGGSHIGSVDGEYDGTALRGFRAEVKLCEGRRGKPTR